MDAFHSADVQKTAVLAVASIDRREERTINLSVWLST
jgi:hypothetical protein